MKLRVPLTGAVLLTFLVALQAGAHRHRPDHLLMTFESEWNAGNVEGMVDLFEADADFSYAYASYARGRDEIRRLLSRTVAAERAGTLRLRNRLNYREYWHWALIDYRAQVTLDDGTRPLIVTAVLVQTKDGHGEHDCRENDPCDEWSVAAMRMIEDAEE